jgi:hypothetical protein
MCARFCVGLDYQNVRIWDANSLALDAALDQDEGLGKQMPTRKSTKMRA